MKRRNLNIENKVSRIKIYKPKSFIDGAEGFIKWVEDYIFLPIFFKESPIPVWTLMSKLPPEYLPMWEAEKDVFREALKMKNNRFIYRLIVFCWQRGEGKSFAACLIQLWKFFNFPRQQIMLGANSKDQVKFVHYDVMRDIILNSPRLLAIIGRQNIQEKEIRLKDKAGNVVSLIRSISSFSGIVSNISGYTFSEMFDMKNPKFFTQLDGSIRNIPNAFGVIDSTVSDQSHILYKLYKTSIATDPKKRDPSLFFHYKCSEKGHIGDYWNPNMTEGQLHSYKVKFPLGDFERYFLNIWSAGSEKVFSKAFIKAIHYLGVDGRNNNHDDLINVWKKIIRYEDKVNMLKDKGLGEVLNETIPNLAELYGRLNPIDKVYTLSSYSGTSEMCTVEGLNRLTEIYDTDWAIMSGVDRADPMKKSKTPAKTIVSLIAKGLVGSKSNYMVFKEGETPNYIYILLHLFNVKNSSLAGIKDVLREGHLHYGGIDTLCSERWGMWDMEDWCEENGIKFEVHTNPYPIQKAAFTQLHDAVLYGNFKSPNVGIKGMREDDLLEEEMTMFDHDVAKKWFGSPEKGDRYGIQDDSMYSIGCNLYGGRNLTMDDFQPRFTLMNFGEFYKGESKVADY